MELFLIPGGEPKDIIHNPEMKEAVNLLNKLLKALVKNDCKIAAICGEPTFLANSGVLKNKRCTGSIKEDEREFFEKTRFLNHELVKDGVILTAQGQVFSKFAVEISQWLDVINNEEEAE